MLCDRVRVEAQAEQSCSQAKNKEGGLGDGVCEQIDGEGGTSGLDQCVQKASIHIYAEGGPSDKICVETNFENDELAGNKMNVDGGMSNQMCMEPNFSNENDTAVRHWAKKLTSTHL